MSELYYGDNLPIMRGMRSESVDLIYLDPPFNSNATYNVLFKAPGGEHSAAQIEAFEDTWHWNTTSAEAAFDDVMKSSHSDVAELLRVMRSFLSTNDMMAYITHIAVRLLEMHRVLRPTGSIYLHCDPTASHYIKVLMDAVFGKDRFLNEIVWKRTGAHGGAKRWAPVHDTILFYSKSDEYTWTRPVQPYEAGYVESRYVRKDSIGSFQDVSVTGAGTRTGASGAPWRGMNPTDKGRHWAIPDAAGGSIAGFADMSPQAKLDALDAMDALYWPKSRQGKISLPRIKQRPGKGNPVQDCITDIAALNSQAQERLHYPTQKPVALMERIIAASSREGDTILDPFCGCGTTIHAAQKLGRKWIGIDITHLAIGLIQRRLKDAFGPDIPYQVHGVPRDLEGAKALAAQEKYDFQHWAVSLVDGVSYRSKKKGADGGIDGIFYFKADPKTTERAIISVKGGGVGVKDIRELISVVDRERAKIGVYICLENPTGPMVKEAAGAGFYVCPLGRRYPKIQICTIADLLGGQKPQTPIADPSSFRRAAIEQNGAQGDLGL